MIPLLPAVKKRTEGFRKAAVQVQGVGISLVSYTLPFFVLLCLFPLSIPSGVKKQAGLATNNDSVGSAQLRKWCDSGSPLVNSHLGGKGHNGPPGP